MPLLDVHKIGSTGNEDRGQPDEAMKGRHELWHGGHLNLHRDWNADQRPREEPREDNAVIINVWAQKRHNDRYCHSGHGECVASKCRLGMA